MIAFEILDFGTCSAAGLFKSMALSALARRAAHLPGLLPELRPHLRRLLVGQSDALQAATLALLEALLPKEPDAEAGVGFGIHQEHVHLLHRSASWIGFRCLMRHTDRH